MGPCIIGARRSAQTRKARDAVTWLLGKRVWRRPSTSLESGGRDWEEKNGNDHDWPLRHGTEIVYESVVIEIAFLSSMGWMHEEVFRTYQPSGWLSLAFEIPLPACAMIDRLLNSSAKVLYCTFISFHRVQTIVLPR
jgi:hypothetical protein